jgi:hypothetical protein
MRRKFQLVLKEQSKIETEVYSQILRERAVISLLLSWKALHPQFGKRESKMIILFFALKQTGAHRTLQKLQWATIICESLFHVPIESRVNNKQLLRATINQNKKFRPTPFFQNIQKEWFINRPENDVQIEISSPTSKTMGAKEKSKVRFSGMT